VPCLLEGCDRHIDSYSDCLQQLPARRVIAAAAALLDRTPSPVQAAHAV
jgi:heptosyltransferase-3